MKYLIVTDIHGGINGTKFIVDEFLSGGYDKILCLGDVLYHGPRNDIPLDYAPKEVIKLLNSVSDSIIWVRGNCDAEVDEMVLNFKVLDHIDINLNGYKIHLEHGHKRDLYKGECDVFIFGHTHIPYHEYKGNTLWLNPGSITIPKEASTKNYMIFDDNKFICKSIDGNIIFTETLKK